MSVSLILLSFSFIHLHPLSFLSSITPSSHRHVYLFLPDTCIRNWQVFIDNSHVVSGGTRDTGHVISMAVCMHLRVSVNTDVFSPLLCVRVSVNTDVFYFSVRMGERGEHSTKGNTLQGRI